MKDHETKPTGPVSVAISELIKNPDQYREIIKIGLETAKENLSNEHKQGRVFNDYPALVDEKTLNALVKKTKSILKIPQDIIDVATGLNSEEPSATQLKDAEKARALMGDVYDTIATIGCQELLNPQKIQVDPNVARILIGGDAKPVPTLASFIECVSREIIVQVDINFKLDFAKKWGDKTVTDYETLSNLIQSFEHKSEDAKEADFAKLGLGFSIEKYKEDPSYKTHFFKETFGDDFLKSYEDEYTKHKAETIKISVMSSRFQQNWHEGEPPGFFSRFCANHINSFYYGELFEKFHLQLTEKNARITLKPITNDEVAKKRSNEVKVISEAINQISLFKQGEINLYDLAKDIGKLQIYAQDTAVEKTGLFGGAAAKLSHKTTRSILDHFLNELVKVLSKKEQIQLKDFLTGIKLEKASPPIKTRKLKGTNGSDP